MLGAVVATSLTQTRHLVRTGSAAGISPSAQIMVTVSWAVWAAISVQERLWTKAAIEAIAAALEGLNVLLVLRRRTGAFRWRPVAGWSALLAMGWPVGGQAGLIVALLVYDLTILVPMLRAVGWRRCLAGVSSVSRVLALTTAVAWCIYAVGVGEPATAAWAFFYAPAYAFIVARVLHHRLADDCPTTPTP